ncbi:MAG: hypothetical protein GXO87_02415, partial [Chlorobi bacterium]|nr:hypothetical protein [Chlorobiota bacterium]
MSFIIILLFAANVFFAQSSPHGANLKLECAACHTAENWNKLKEPLQFDHDKTEFKLTGQHKDVNCQNCHKSLEFDKADVNCESCHTDMHQGSVGFDCARCHDTDSWLVKDITGMHETSRFPLLGNHKAADCYQCHNTESLLNFEPLGVDCFGCHSDKYYAAKSPDHAAGNFSTDCTECHDMASPFWSTTNFNHEVFPLTGGHAISDCFACHATDTFAGLSQDCYVCHKSNYDATTNPNHTANGFSTDCQACHTLSPGWSPALFTDHNSIYELVGAHAAIASDCQSCHTDTYAGAPTECAGCHHTNYENTTNPDHLSAGFDTDCQACHSQTAWVPAADFDHDNLFFPIYSGSHNGAWTNCADCHTTQSDYAQFSCIDCHEHDKTGTDEEHGGVNGYVYATDACFSCHPTGSGEGGFNHATTQFPLTGAHLSTDCTQCHINGYAGTPLECASCHQENFNSATNPNHTNLGLSTSCGECHSTDPGWSPAQFIVHDQYFELTGAHAAISSDCASCHNNDYNVKRELCADCHLADFNNTTNPNHQQVQFTNDCETCHSTSAWTPSTFDHDNQYFPIYSGKHNGEWDNCADCHTISSDYGQFSCIDCHEHDRANTDEEHSGVAGYIYESNECLACHPTGDGDGAFNHALSQFPLTGAHITTDCSLCHSNGYANTSTECMDCHIDKYNGAQSPNHQSAGISADCQTCHNTGAWQPSTFDHTTTGFELAGSHFDLQCADCHEGNTTSAVNECVACHRDKYSNAPEHVSQNYPTTCELCHNTNIWEETTFDHNSTNFPLTGSHSTVDCASCHTSGYTGTPQECISCHQD